MREEGLDVELVSLETSSSTFGNESLDADTISSTEQSSKPFRGVTMLSSTLKLQSPGPVGEKIAAEGDCGSVPPSNIIFSNESKGESSDCPDWPEPPLGTSRYQSSSVLISVLISFRRTSAGAVVRSFFAPLEDVAAAGVGRRPDCCCAAADVRALTYCMRLDPVCPPDS